MSRSLSLTAVTATLAVGISALGAAAIAQPKIVDAALRGQQHLSQAITTARAGTPDIACEIRQVRRYGSTEFVAELVSQVPVAGNYRFRIVSGGANSVHIKQSGEFRSAGGRA